VQRGGRNLPFCRLMLENKLNTNARGEENEIGRDSKGARWGGKDVAIVNPANALEGNP